MKKVTSKSTDVQREAKSAGCRLHYPNTVLPPSCVFPGLSGLLHLQAFWATQESVQRTVAPVSSPQLLQLYYVPVLAAGVEMFKSSGKAFTFSSNKYISSSNPKKDERVFFPPWDL